ncbi:hypothetical protein [Burkholderia sp. MSMB1589WGS]|uniref:hypothetical protein n=1 Tax=Burkholderia sp. MSMB1589WGS TaxID=1636425 RepID=UPI0012E8EC75|nr:hypothetical protein [Burkholderia sp. MSMB1589WGS]
MKKRAPHKRFPEKCLVCGKRCPEKMTPAASVWDWFHGYLPAQAHFCPEHKVGELRDRLLRISAKKPETWTSEEQKFVAAFLAELNAMG